MTPTSATPSIRHATSEDAAALARVHIDSWRVAYRGLVPDSRLDGLDYGRRAARFRDELQEGPAETYVVEQAECILGFLTLDGCRDPDVDAQATGEIWGIYLAPQAWRRGTGTLLCRHAEQILASRGYGEIKLWVLAGNIAARRFYEALGFRPDGASKVLDLGAPLEAVRYSKIGEAASAAQPKGDEPCLR
jgi:ribosomal protein S18 acetylase RimI-like enzyme